MPIGFKTATEQVPATVAARASLEVVASRYAWSDETSAGCIWKHLTPAVTLSTSLILGSMAVPCGTVLVIGAKVRTTADAVGSASSGECWVAISMRFLAVSKVSGMDGMSNFPI